MKKGKLIVIYGVNNIGKTTQAKRIIDYLKSKGYDSEYLKYPIYDSPTGNRISDILRSGKEQSISEEEFQTLYFENRKEFEPTLKKKIDAGAIVVAEDYIGTGLSWGFAKGADYDKLKEQNSVLIQEDLGILMDGERFLEGKEDVHLHEANDGWIRIVRDKLLDMKKEFKWKVVAANQPEENVFDDIKAIIDKKIVEVTEHGNA